MSGIVIFVTLLLSAVACEAIATVLSERRRQARIERAWRERVLASFSEYDWDQE
jgi:hypothetical protein